MSFSPTKSKSSSGPPGLVKPRRRAVSAHSTLSAHGAPLVWLTGGALVTALVMIIGLLALVLFQGLRTFWPQPITLLEVLEPSGQTTKFLGEVTRSDLYKPEPSRLETLKKESPTLFAKAEEALAADDGQFSRQLIWTGKTATLDFAGNRAVWVDDFAVVAQSQPQWAVMVERFDGGRSYGTPAEFRVAGKAVASEPAEVLEKFNEFHGPVMDRVAQATSLDKNDRGAIDRQQRAARLDVVGASLDVQDALRDDPGNTARIERLQERLRQREEEAAELDRWAATEKARISEEKRTLEDKNAKYVLVLKTVGGDLLELPLANIVRGYAANQLSVWGKLGVYISRWWEFVSTAPRGANDEGGVFPAIWGTAAMTIIMSILVVPFGVLAALYLREYAKAGPVVSAIRISINNLAGVPSIVFGVFGLGLFCYVIGASIDQVFFRAALAEGTPTFGTGGILWASLTLALLTLPVVIVATEEALAAVPNSMREGSYACGASKWQTIWRIVLPRAMPGIMTGMILAMARGAGEVAPLILVGVKDSATSLPVDGNFPFFHPQSSFMHLAYQIFYVGFKSPNAEAAKAMVFTSTLLLIAMVAFLNIAAVYLRSRLRRKFVTTQF